MKSLCYISYHDIYVNCTTKITQLFQMSFETSNAVVIVDILFLLLTRNDHAVI